MTVPAAVGRVTATVCVAIARSDVHTARVAVAAVVHDHDAVIPAVITVGRRTREIGSSRTRPNRARGPNPMTHGE